MTQDSAENPSPAVASIDDLLVYFRSGEKPSGQWRLGTEHEKIGFCANTRKPVPYEGERGIRAVMEGFVNKFGWTPVMEGDHPIALERDGASITLEPGGQVELSGAPLLNTHEVCAEMAEHLRQIQEISDPLDIVWLTLGRNPSVPHEEMPWVPKQRYQIMRRYLPQQGTMALDMMVGTGTVQTNIDYDSETDMARKLRASMAVSPVLTALFANSPFASGGPSGYLSSRSRIWQHTDPARCGIVPGSLEEGFTYRDYAEWALDVPMFFIHRDDRYLDYAGQSFRRFMEKGLDGHHATYDDWVLHLSTLFPEVRLKNYLELRMCDAGSRDMVCALSALTRGLLYDKDVLEDLTAMIRDIKPGLFPHALDDAARWGLQAELAGKPVWEWARDLLALAKTGLVRLNALDPDGQNEVFYLSPLEEIVESGNSHAALLMKLWNGEWKQNLGPLFSESYFH